MLHTIPPMAPLITPYLSSLPWQTPCQNWMVISGDSSPWYVDTLKAALGSLFGAWVAFLFAMQHRKIQEKDANLRAGNMALFKLRAIQRRTGEIRLGIRHNIKEVRDCFPEAPPWAILKPIFQSMDDMELVDLDSLSFLLDSASGQDAIKYVKHVEEVFATFKSIVALHQEAAIEFQKATVDLYRSNRNASYEQIGEHVGPELLERRNSLFLSILQNIEQNPEINKAGFTKLETAMQDRFHDKVWKLDIDFDTSSQRAEPNLPPLPEDLAITVSQLPK